MFALRSLLVLLFLIGVVHNRAEDAEEDLGFFMPHAPEQDPEKLQRVYELALALREKSVQQPSAVALAVAGAASTVPPVPLVRGLRLIKDLPPEAHEHLPLAIDVLASIRELGTAAACFDHPATPHGPPGAYSYLIAANLYECEAIMPFWLMEVLRLGLLLKGDETIQKAYFPMNVTDVPIGKGRVSISIYESGSEDNTVTWLRIAEAVWTAAGIPNTVVINGLLTRQSLMDENSGRFYKQHRIQYLASLRNAALEPMYSAPPGTYDYVLFINDVFFCAPDVLRLAHLEADIACGLDFEVWVGNKKGRMSGVTQRFAAEKGRRSLLAEEDGSAAADASNSTLGLPDWRTAIEHMSAVHVEESARQAAADSRVQAAKIQPRYEFYDTWVSRDLSGNPFIKIDPLSRDVRTVDLLHRGLPIPAKCCWNGMALLNASYFNSGLRFRAALATEGEFDISECSLFCEDYRRLGATRVAVDPSVRVSYLVWTKEFHGKLPGGVGAKVPWGLIQRSAALEELRQIWNETDNDMLIQWIPLRKGSEEADMDKFRMIDLKVVNYTDIFLQDLKNPKPPATNPSACNLIMGPYGSPSDGLAFDDLAASGFGDKRLSAFSYGNNSGLQFFQVSYDGKPTYLHGTVGNGTSHVTLGSEEFVNRATVYYDDTVVYGVLLGTSAGRNLTLGEVREDASVAWAIPCPARGWYEPKHRLIAFSGTADKMVRSISLIWTDA